MKCSLTLLLLAISSTSFAASSGMKAGLWEHSFTMKSQSGQVEKSMAEMKKQMEKMPAEQRKFMEDMMAKQGLGLSGGMNSVKVCISKEQADNLDIPQKQNDNCTQEITSRTDKSVKMKFDCKGSQPSSGEGEFTLTSPTAYTGKAVINTTTQGKPDRMDMDQKGKWLSADCGNIKPIPTKK